MRVEHADVREKQATQAEQGPDATRLFHGRDHPDRSIVPGVAGPNGGIASLVSGV